MKISLTLDEYISQLLDEGKECFAHLSYIEERRLTGFILMEGFTLSDMGEFFPESFYQKIVAPVLSLSINCLEQESYIFLMLMTFVKSLVNFHSQTIDMLLQQERQKRYNQQPIRICNERSD